MMRFTGSPSSPSPSGATSCNRSSRTTRRGRDLDRLTLRPWDRRILLVDADAFYVAVARLVDPDGAGKAPLLIVGGSAQRRGVVTSASYEARAYGVHSAMPMARAIRLCPSATVVPVPWEACARKSGEIRDVLRRFTPAGGQGARGEVYIEPTRTDELDPGGARATAGRRDRAAGGRGAGRPLPGGGGA